MNYIVFRSPLYLYIEQFGHSHNCFLKLRHKLQSSSSSIFHHLQTEEVSSPPPRPTLGQFTP